MQSQDNIDTQSQDNIMYNRDIDQDEINRTILLLAEKRSCLIKTQVNTGQPPLVERPVNYPGLHQPIILFMILTFQQTDSFWLNDIGYQILEKNIDAFIDILETIREQDYDDGYVPTNEDMIDVGVYALRQLQQFIDYGYVW